MTFTEKYKITDVPTGEEDRRVTDQTWDRYVAALEKDYTSAINKAEGQHVSLKAKPNNWKLRTSKDFSVSTQNEDAGE